MGAIVGLVAAAVAMIAIAKFIEITLEDES